MNKLKDQVVARRIALGRAKLPDNGSHLWGLALSGGGIRSATFCFGLLRAFARAKLLLRFDVLSTVSGGGYIGGMVGRLFSRCSTPMDARRVQQALGEARANWFVWWLRANGRYLIPRGAKDATFVIGLFLRNLVAVHFELALVALGLGAVLAIVTLLAWQLVVWLGYYEPNYLFPFLQDLPDWALLWFPAVWLALPFVAAVGAVRAAAYWLIPWVSGREGIVAGWWLVLAGTVTLIAVYWFGNIGDSPVGAVLRTTLYAVTASLLVLWLLGVPTAKWYLTRADNADLQAAEEARTKVTRALANSFRWFSVIWLAGVVDRCAWFLAFELEPLTETGQGGAALWLAGAAAVIRAALPLTSRLRPGRAGTVSMLFVGRVLGYALTFLLCVWWVSLVHKAVLGAAFTIRGVSFFDAWLTLLLLAVPLAGFILVTGRNVGFLNISSLHAFYRARIVRSYLGAANGARFKKAPAPLSALDEVPAVSPEGPEHKMVEDIVADDDLSLDQYTPQLHGGPVHILSVCVNQTKDPRGGLFNQDRRGLAMSVASGGLYKVPQRDWTSTKGRPSLSLGSWMAISGAAFAPGLGSLTRGGLSALATFAGVRLGFWWDKGPSPNTGTKKPGVLAKSYGILCETFGVFEGTDEQDWFLTDGGHFENTGAYALLAERAEVIVIADCGADPKYGFEDLENLVRKARIDLQTEILFQRPKVVGQPKQVFSDTVARKFKFAKPQPPAPPPAPLARFGSLNDLASSTSTACLALAKVKYSGQTPSDGILIVIKPNLCSGLPVDLVNFKDKNPLFPQETTADQSFSEAQWESYFHLGTFLGQNLTKDFIYELIADSNNYFENDDCSPFETTAQDIQASESKPTAGQSGRIPSRIGTAATAVGTTLGLGAAATLGVTVWQAIETTKDSYTKQTADERAALRELADLWAKATSHGSAAPDAVAAGNLAAALIRTADNLCPTNEEGWFIKSDLARRIHQSAFDECRMIPPPQLPLACTALLATNGPLAVKQTTTCLVAGPEVLGVLPPPRYWVYDYTGEGSATNAHPCDQVVLEREKANMVLSRPPAATEPTCNFTGRFVNLIVPPAPPPAPAKSDECKDITVYRQIYGPEQRKEVRGYREHWEKMGANVPRTEDVVDTARSRGYTSPLPVSTTTVRFHDTQSSACASKLGPAIDPTFKWKVEPLSAKFRPRPRTIEVWVAPNPKPARAPEPPPQKGSMEATPPPVRESQTPK